MNLTELLILLGTYLLAILAITLSAEIVFYIYFKHKLRYQRQLIEQLEKGDYDHAQQDC